MINYISAVFVALGIFLLFPVRNGSDYQTTVFIILSLVSTGMLLWNFFKTKITSLLVSVAIINLLAVAIIYYYLSTIMIY